MIRISILIIFFILAMVEYRKPLPPAVFRLAFLGMTLFLALRCGQGTDYFSYSYIYTNEVTPDVEPGYALLNQLFIKLHLPYTVFVFVFALLTMAVLYFIIEKFAQNKFMAFFVVYALYYLQYFENGIRQAIAMLLVLAGFCLTVRRNRVWYLLGALLLAYTLHTSSLVGGILLLPYFLDKSEKIRAFMQRRRTILLILFAGLCAAFLWLSYSGGLGKIAHLLPEAISVKVTGYLMESSYSKMALLSRLVFLAVLSFLYYCAGDGVPRLERLLMQSYLLGFLLYCVIFGSDLIASRINAYFKLSEILLIPNLIFYFDLNRIRRPLFAARRLIPRLTANRGLYTFFRGGVVSAVCLLLAFMYCKTTKDVMEQSLYYNPSYWNYPYFSVFSDMRKLDDLRDAPTFMHMDYYAFVEKGNPRLVAVGPNGSRAVFPALPVFVPEQEESVSTENVFAPDPLSEQGAVMNFVGGEEIRPKEGGTAPGATVQPLQTPARRIKDCFTSDR